MKNLNKRCIFIFAILLVLVLLGFSLWLSTSNNGLSRDEVQTLLDKQNSLTNIYIKYYTFPQKIISENETNLFTEFFRYNDNAQVVYTSESGNKIINQENKSTGECIFISERLKNIMYTSNDVSAFSLGFGCADISNISDYKTFKYLGETSIEDRKNIIVFLQYDDNSPKDYVFIDIETGIITKHISIDNESYMFDFAQIKTLDNDNFVINIDEKYPDYKVFKP